ncbi:MAG: hypothetical protein GXO60_06830 [Epsilonproteobacteria bacterium]|nr:hypothetical protein [Campylobacterota bacterium]
MNTKETYVTITHYKEREFYFLNYAIQTEDGFIPKEIEQFHESDKLKFIERIRKLQSQYPQNNIVSISLVAKQFVSQENDRNRATARIFNDNFVTQEEIDVGDIPTTLYFSPFAILYEYYKDVLNEKLTLFIGLFDRKLFMMFATADKIHQSWIIGTRGLTEKQIADRVYKSMQAYYKISYNFAEHIEMLVTDESPKLLKVLREELSLHIELSQSNIHNLLHHMASSQEIAQSSYIKSFKKIELSPTIVDKKSKEEALLEIDNKKIETKAFTKNEPLDDIKIKDNKRHSFLEGFKSFFSLNSSDNSSSKSSLLFSILPLILVLGLGGFFSIKNNKISNEVSQKRVQILAHKRNLALEKVSENLFQALGKNAELKKATISTDAVDIKGIVWGIEPLKNSLTKLYRDGRFVIKPLENFMTEFSFTSK